MPVPQFPQRAERMQWPPSSRRCQLGLARTVSGRGAVTQRAFARLPGAVPCASRHRGTVNSNGNGNRRRLIPAPGAGRAGEGG